GTRKTGLDELQTLLQAPLPRPEAAKAPADWLLFRGSAARLGISAAKPPPADAIERAWQANGVEGVMGKGWLTNAITATHARGQAVLPGFAPIVIGDKILYRTQQGVRALHAQTGELLWESVSLDNGFDSLADHVDKNISSSVNLWVGNYLSNYPNVLL